MASEAAETLEGYSQNTADFIREQGQQMQSTVAMLTATLSDVSGQCEDSVARLNGIEQKIERASGLDDIQELNASLQNCLVDLREAASQHRKSAAATAERLEGQIRDAQQRVKRDHAIPAPSETEVDLDPEPPESQPDLTVHPYVAAFKLHRADHIVGRFGDNARRQMLSLVWHNLKTALGPSDRLMRWKGTSFVVFISSPLSLGAIRAQLAETVSKTGQHYIEVGKRTILLSIVLDWTVFPQDGFSSMDSVFKEVDAFLTTAENQPPSMSIMGRSMER